MQLSIQCFLAYKYLPHISNFSKISSVVMVPTINNGVVTNISPHITQYIYYWFLGTSDEHITVMENLRSVPQCSAILVTTPQEVAIEDVRKEITFCRKTGIPIMGIIENMSGWVGMFIFTWQPVFLLTRGKQRHHNIIIFIIPNNTRIYVWKI